MSTQETSGENSSGTPSNTNKKKGKSGRKRGPIWAHFNDFGAKKKVMLVVNANIVVRLKTEKSQPKCKYIHWSKTRQTWHSSLYLY
ncbi:hypothetical protein RIR_jg9529.t1 [Rhizophagus irregularis DAOM 181602=DAOM 197198]|nr:hypothetical protein RIR_jg9529.t1 [Rhizophagus irregularis DAOM 181602=DAOM 197198]